MFQVIAEAHVNIRYSYLATGNRLVIASTDPRAVLAALARSGFTLARPVARGSWCAEPGAPTYQDLLIAYNR